MEKYSPYNELKIFRHLNRIGGLLQEKGLRRFMYGSSLQMYAIRDVIIVHIPMITYMMEEKWRNGNPYHGILWNV